ncbi:MAG: fumarylacetoacetate hydrolase family protein [Proteobacteria bacterium]|nr:fumarylacetoacetate hydrolase family protein [Pseudomonadota bacterium]
MRLHDTLTAALDDALLRATAIAPFAEQHSLNVDDAYRIQQAGIGRRLQRGERVTGLKMGFTSVAKMQQMGVTDQICGTLTDAMQIDNGASLDLQQRIHPRCEPELAFLLKQDVPPDADAATAHAAIAAVAPAIEIIDSRFRQFRFSLVDVIADNASSSAFVLGSWHDCPADLTHLPVELHIDGRLAQSGSSADILGDPLRSLLAAARLARRAGIALTAGSIVLAGAATPAVALQPGQHIEAHVAGMGEATFYVSTP